MAFERAAYIEAVVGADITAFRRGMRDVRNELGILSEDVGGLQKLGRTLTYTLTAPLIVGATAAAQAASQFDANMRNINSIVQLTEGELASLSDEIQRLGVNTRQGAIGLSESYYTLASAGYVGADAIDVASVAVKTAEAGLSDMAVTTEALAAIMLSYGLKGEQGANRASNALTRMVQLGVGSMEAFAGSIATALPMGAALGVQFEEVAAIGAIFTQRGYSAAEAMVRVNAVMRSMAKPADAMKEAFDKLGVQGAEQLIVKFGGLNKAVKALVATTDGSSQAIFELFSETRAVQGVQSLVNNIDDTREQLALFNQGLEDATDSAWQEQTKSFAYQWDLLKSAIQGAAITIGEQLLPIITPVVQKFTEFIKTIANANPDLVRFGVGLAAVAAVLPPLLWVSNALLSPFRMLISVTGLAKDSFGALANGLSFIVRNGAIGSLTIGLKALGGVLLTLLSPVGILIGGITALGVAFVTNFDKIKDALNSVVGDGFAQDILEDLGLVPKRVQESINSIPTSIQPVPLATKDVITVKAGDSWWGIWAEKYKGQFTWDEFKKALSAQGIDVKAVIHAGDVIEFSNDRSVFDAGASQFKAGMDDMITTLSTDIPAMRREVELPLGIKLDEENFLMLEEAWNTKIRPLLDKLVKGLNLDTVANAFGKLKDALAEWASAMSKADWSGVLKLAGILAGAALTTFFSLMANTGVLIAEGIKAVAQVLPNFINALARLAEGDLQGFATNIIAGFRDFLSALSDMALEVLKFPVNILNDIIKAVNDAFNLKLPDLDGVIAWIDDAKLKVQQALNPTDVQTQGANFMRALAGSFNFENWDYGDTSKQISFNFSTLFESLISDTANFGSFSLTPEGTLQFSFSETALEVNDPAELAEKLWTLLDEKVTMAMADPAFATLSPETKGVWEALLDSLIVAADSVDSSPQALGVSQATKDMLMSAITTGLASFKSFTAQFKPIQDAVSTGVGTAISEGMANPTLPEGATIVPEQAIADMAGALQEAGIALDPASIQTSFVQPLSTAFTTVFGTEGTATVAYRQFAADVQLQTTNMGISLVNFLTNSTIVTGALTVLWSLTMTAMTLATSAAVFAINELGRAIDDLRIKAVDPINVSINVTKSGDIAVDGSHKAGLASVPYDGYVAELHKGERVLNAREARAYNSGTGTSTQNNTIVVNGVQDVDAMLRELRRRGIRLA